jgi:ABC-type transporter Mla subunit MlaD
MDTAISITLGDLAFILIGGALFILLVYCILLLKNLLPSVKVLSKILADVEVVTDVTASSTKEIQKAVVELSSSAGVFAKAIKDNQNVISALTSVVNALRSLQNLFSKFK